MYNRVIDFCNLCYNLDSYVTCINLLFLPIRGCKYMKQEDYIKIINNYEECQKQNPKKFKRKVLCILASGYLYFFAVLLALSLVIVLLVLYSLPFLSLLGSMGIYVFVILLFIFTSTCVTIFYTIKAILKFLFVKMDKPKGVILKREEEPELFELISKYKKELNSSKIHKVLLSNDMNAYIMQRPLFGVFGFFRNYLVIGMPVLCLLSKKQFESVLVHEIAHISKAHGRVSRWIYRIRVPWKNVIEESGLSDLFLYRRFYNWLIPRLSAITFIISRAGEYEADKVAALYTSSKNVSDSLALINILEEHMKSDFWNNYYKKSIHYENAVPIYPTYKEFFQTEIPEERFKQIYNQTLNIQTEYHDTHPSYIDRIKAISQEPDYPEVSKVNAASELFGSKLYDHLEKLEKMWAKDIEYIWTVEREDRLDMKEQLYEINRKARIKELTEDEMINRAYWTEQVLGEAEALPLYEEILEKNSFNAYANYFVGRKMILGGDSKGMELLNTAVERNLDIVIPGAALICDFLVKEGRKEEAEKYYKSVSYRRDLYYKLQYYRNNLSYYDTLRPHDLQKNELSKLEERLHRIDDLEEVYLLKREVRDIDIKEPIYIIIYRSKRYLMNGKSKNDELVRKLNRVAPKNTIILDIRKVKSKEYLKSIKNIKMSKVI